MLLRRNMAKDAELLVLRHENAVLRQQLCGLVRYEPADRFWLAALSSRYRAGAGAVSARRSRRGALPTWHRRLMAKSGTATATGHTDHETNDHPKPVNSQRCCTTACALGCCAPVSSTGSSTSTNTRLEPKR